MTERKEKRRQQAEYRKKNKERKEYFRQYYSGERYEKQKKDMYRRMVMAQEAGRTKRNGEKWLAKKNKPITDGTRMIIVEGHKMFKAKWALENLIKHLKYTTICQYIDRGIIPKPILVRKTKTGKNRYYLSQRQIRMINHLWHGGKKKKRKPLKERSEYLWANWTRNELGFGSDSDN
jgi:hypothetical protein